MRLGQLLQCRVISIGTQLIEKLVRINVLIDLDVTFVKTAVILYRHGKASQPLFDAAVEGLLWQSLPVRQLRAEPSQACVLKNLDEVRDIIVAVRFHASGGLIHNL